MEEIQTLEEIQEHPLDVYNVSDRVIQARKLHHGHFFAKGMDYGHEKYLNTLINKRLTYQKALERVTMRMANVLFQNQKWFKWAREVQEEEEKQKENEQKKIKREAALFRRQVKEVNVRTRQLRAKEDARRQDQYLEQAYREGLANQPDEFDDVDLDPIQDYNEDQRSIYILLIRHFLWEDIQQDLDISEEVDASVDEPSTNALREPLTEISNIADAQIPELDSSDRNGKKKKKAKGKGQKRSAPPAHRR